MNENESKKVKEKINEWMNENERKKKKGKETIKKDWKRERKKGIENKCFEKRRRNLNTFMV